MELILIELLNLASSDKIPVPSMIPIEDIKKSFQHLAKMTNMSVDELIYHKDRSDRIPKIILWFNSKFETLQREQEKIRLFHTFQFFVESLKDKIFRSCSWRGIVHTILRLMKLPKLHRALCTILSDQIKRASESTEERQAHNVSLCAEEIIAALIPFGTKKHLTKTPKPNWFVDVVSQFFTSNVLYSRSLSK